MPTTVIRSAISGYTNRSDRLRTLRNPCRLGVHYTDAGGLAAALGKKPSGELGDRGAAHNGLIELDSAPRSERLAQPRGQGQGEGRSSAARAGSTVGV